MFLSRYRPFQRFSAARALEFLLLQINVLALQLFGAFAVGYVAGNKYNISHSEDNGSRTRHGVSTIDLSVCSSARRHAPTQIISASQSLQRYFIFMAKIVISSCCGRPLAQDFAALLK